MGAKIVEAALTTNPHPTLSLAKFDNYLCRLTPETYSAVIPGGFKETMTGADFLSEFGPIRDSICEVDAEASVRTSWLCCCLVFLLVLFDHKEVVPVVVEERSGNSTNSSNISRVSSSSNNNYN